MLRHDFPIYSLNEFHDLVQVVQQGLNNMGRVTGN